MIYKFILIDKYNDRFDEICIFMVKIWLKIYFLLFFDKFMFVFYEKKICNIFFKF